jgi:hypothetical protein
MIQLAEVFPDEKVVVSLIRHLTWTHFIALIPLRDPLARDFCAEMSRIERCSSGGCTRRWRELARASRSRGSSRYDRNAC